MKRTDVVSLLAGSVFAVGLGLSGMTQPAKVIAFLDVTGDWDPSLALVMLGAIAVHAIAIRLAKSTSAPVLAPCYKPPTATALDRRLLLGAALFGLGWGMAGLCPGPAVVSVVSLRPDVLAFVGSMLAGMLVHKLFFDRTPGGSAKPGP